MSTFPAPWALCGGWAVDAWLGHVTREHGDADFAVFDQPALFEYLAVDWELVAHDATVAGNTMEPWNGRALSFPAHVHGRRRATGSTTPDRLDDPGAQGFALDIQVNDRDGDDWVICGRPRISVRLSEAIRPSRWGLPTVVPEVLLIYKAGGAASAGLDWLRRRDKLDLLALLPHLTREQRDWLHKSVELLGHPWLSLLAQEEAAAGELA
jgi:hypothetical protein